MIGPSVRAPSANTVVLLWALAQVAVFGARLRPGAPYPVSGRFSWSMFAGPLAGRCHHDLRAARADGSPVPRPPPSHPLRAVLDARDPGEFSAAVGLFAPYADDDPAVARALDALLARWARTLPPGSRVESALRCETPGAPPFARTATFAGGAP